MAKAESKKEEAGGGVPRIEAVEGGWVIADPVLGQVVNLTTQQPWTSRQECKAYFLEHHAVRTVIVEARPEEGAPLSPGD